jgi:glycosyltransferase involved in cell wall biosynthesis
LQKLGDYEVSLFAITDDQKSDVLTELLKDGGISIGSIPHKFYYGHLRRGVELIKFALRVRKMKPDLIMSYTIRPNTVAGAVWNLTGAKGFIWNQVDMGFGFTKNHRDKILMWALRNTPLFISNSGNGLESLKNYYPKAKNASIIKWGVELKKAIHDKSHWRTELKIPKDAKTGIMVGNLTSFKDQITLVKAWVRLHSDENLNKPYLILAGYHGDKYQEISRAVNESGLEDFIKMPGSVADISGLILASDLCVFSSLSEGLPAGITECMAAGLPVVATDIQGNKEALGDDYPFLVKPGDPEAFAESIKTLLLDDQLSESVGKNNKSRCENEFSQVESFKKYENAIKSLLR